MFVGYRVLESAEKRRSINKSQTKIINLKNLNFCLKN